MSSVGDELSARATAAARAFAALNLDTGTHGGDTGHGEPGGVDTEVVDLGTVAHEIVDAEIVDAEVIDETGPASAWDAGGLGDGPLRPDAVLRPSSGGVATRAVPEPRHQPSPRPSPAPAPPANAPSRGDGYLLDLGAAALASGAFVWPRAWLGGVAFAAAAATLVRALVHHGLAPAVVLRGIRARLRPGPLGRLATVALQVAVAAVVVPAVVCGALWAFRHGVAGTGVAARIGAWAYGPRFAVVLVCYVLIAGTGVARQRRLALVRRLVEQADASTVRVAAVGAVAVAVLMTVVVPRSGGGSESWAPAWIDGRLARVRTVVVEAELAAATGCLARAQALPWQSAHERGTDRVGLVLRDALPEPGDVTTALLALHNQLAPWVRTIEIGGPDQVVLTVDRSRLPDGQPIDEPEELIEAVTTGRALVAADAPDYDRSLALDCSLSPVL
jgi:hypothetical protein